MKDGLFAELKRRHVYRVAIAYVIVAWVLLQLASIIFPMYGAPDWVLKVFLTVLVLGFPVALILAWAFEVTPEGVRRTEPADSPDARLPEQHLRVGRTLDFIIIGVLVVAVTLLAWRLHEATQTRSPATPAVSNKPLVSASATAASSSASTAAVIPQKSIAVLPFENLSADKANAYFADGMQDLILTKLSDIGDLAVISRTSTMKYGSHPENLQTIGKRLEVATILEGSVQKAGDQVLINVQLIDARNDHHIWANSYTRTLKNVFSVEGEVATKIAATLKAKLSPAENKRLATTLSDDPAANDLYLRGEYFANRAKTSYDTAAWKQAITYYRKAITKAPDFAQARAQLSFVESELAWFGGGGGQTATLNADALVQAEQALKLAPDLADAHLALGYHDYWGKRDYAAALNAFAAALALRPNDSDALAAKATVLRRQANFDEAIDTFQKALALDPRNTELTFETGETYMLANRYTEAAQTFRRALAVDPTNVNARSDLSFVMMVVHNGDLTGALDEVQGDNPELESARVWLLIYARRYADALALLQSIPDTPDTFSSNNGGPRSMQLANLYHLSGDSAKARALYAKALPQARAQYAALKGSPVINQKAALIEVAQAELGLGQTAKGLADTAKVQAIAEHNSDPFYGPKLMVLCAQNYTYAGKADQAVSLLSKALAAPGMSANYSPVLLWIDPVWDPIRRDPSFQALEKKYAKYRPAIVPKETQG